MCLAHPAQMTVRIMSLLRTARQAIPLRHGRKLDGRSSCEPTPWVAGPARVTYVDTLLPWPLLS
jgi:hypothetical protein